MMIDLNFTPSAAILWGGNEKRKTEKNLKFGDVRNSVGSREVVRRKSTNSDHLKTLIKIHRECGKIHETWA
jgi:hypothetical protein